MSDGEFWIIMIFIGFCYFLPYILLFFPLDSGAKFHEEEESEGTMGWLFGNSKPTTPTADVFCPYSCCYQAIYIKYNELPAKVVCPHSHCARDFLLFQNVSHTGISKVDSATDIQYDVYKTKQRYMAKLNHLGEDMTVNWGSNGEEARRLIFDLITIEMDSSDIDANYAALTFSSIDRKKKIIEKLTKLGNPAIIPALSFLLKDRLNCSRALKAIGKIGGDEAVRILTKLVNLPSEEWVEHGIYNSSERLCLEMEDYGPSYYPYEMKEEALNIMSRMKSPIVIDPLIKNTILEYDSYKQDNYLDGLRNFKSEANTKFSEYLLDRQKLESQIFQKSLTEEEYCMVESYLLKAIGDTGGSDNPIIRSLTIKNIISNYTIDYDDVKIVSDFKTEEELMKALEQEEYVLQNYRKSDWSSHIYHYYPKNKHSDEEIKTIVRTSIVKALGMLWYSKASNSIVKLMQNIKSQKIASKYDLMLIRECAKTLGSFNIKKTLKPIKEIKEFCEKDHDEFSLRYQALKEINKTLALLGERDSVIDIVRQFKSDEEDSELKELIERIDADILGEVFESLELYDDAEKLYTKNGMLEKSAEMRKKKAKMTGSKTVVHGDYVDDRDTIVKDSVINRSNIGSGDKFAKLERLAQMKKEGLIDNDEFKQMKKEIMKN